MSRIYRLFVVQHFSFINNILYAAFRSYVITYNVRIIIMLDVASTL